MPWDPSSSTDLAAEFDGMTGSEAGFAIWNRAGSDLPTTYSCCCAVGDHLKPSACRLIGTKIRNSGIRKRKLPRKNHFPDHRWAFDAGHRQRFLTQSALTFVNGYFCLRRRQPALRHYWMIWQTVSAWMPRQALPNTSAVSEMINTCSFTPPPTRVRTCCPLSSTSIANQHVQHIYRMYSSRHGGCSDRLL